MSYFPQLDDDVKEPNKKTRDVNTILHIGDGYHISIHSEIFCADMRAFYVPYGLGCQDCRPGLRGIALCIEEWVELKDHIDTIHTENPEFATATSCTSNVDHQTTDGWKSCKTCHPWGSD